MMKIENLTKGMVIKNYKEVCLLLEQQVKTGKSKQIQLQDWKRYFDFELSGQKFIIKEIYTMPKEKVDNRKNGNNNTPYIKYIETLILDLLAQSVYKGKDEVFLSKNRLFKEFKMINNNYVFCKNRTLKLSKFMDINKDTIEEWYLSTDGTLKRNLETALDSLKKQSLILWSSEITVCELVVNQNNMVIDKKIRVDEYDEEIITYKVNTGFDLLHREATKEEKKAILRIERDIMLEMGFENKQDIVRVGSWDKFKEKINKIILDKLNISYYYDSYKILFNEDHIQQQYEKIIEEIFLEEEDRIGNKNELNDSIMRRLKDNSQKKQNRAISESQILFGEITNEKLNRRIQDSYIIDTHSLVDVLIDKDYKNINNKVKKIKIS